jgi:hypothetical protein
MIMVAHNRFVGYVSSVSNASNEIRAIFTPRYKPIDNFEVLARLDEMGYTPDTEV